MLKKWILRWSLVVLSIGLWEGCSMPRGAGARAEGKGEYTATLRRAPVHRSMMSASDKSMKLEGVDVVGWLDNPAAVFATENSAPPMPVAKMPAPSAPRMIFHEGWLNLKSTEPQKTLDSAQALAIQLGGYVESRQANHMVLRIPVEKFLPNFDRFMALGVLVSKSMRSDDISDQYADTELRLRIAKATLERLKALLAQSTDSNEKLALLKDIQRVSEQIELDEARRRDLAQKAQYSRLNFDVQPFVFEVDADDAIAAFRWIQDLNPQREEEFLVDEDLTLLVPQDFIDLDLDKTGLPWAAVASDGTELWARTRENNPRGNAAFWIETLRLRLGKPFRSATVSDAGAWKVLQLTSFDYRPYTWMVAVRTDGDDLRVAEAFFPNPLSLSAHLNAVLTVLRGELP